MSVDLKSPEAQAVLGRLIAEENARNEAEIAAQQQAAQQAIAQREQARRAGQANLIEQYKQNVKPAVAAADSQAAALFDSLVAYVRLARQAAMAEYQARASVSVAGRDGGEVVALIASARSAAGLPAQADRIVGIDADPRDDDVAVALVTLRALRLGIVGPGFIQVGSCRIEFQR